MKNLIVTILIGLLCGLIGGVVGSGAVGDVFGAFHPAQPAATSTGNKMLDDRSFDFGTDQDFRLIYDSTNTRWELNDGTNDFLRVVDGGTTATFTFLNNISATSLTDATATLTGGSLTGLILSSMTNASVSGELIAGSKIGDTIATLSAGAFSGLVTLGTIQASVSDGLTVTGVASASSIIVDGPTIQSGIASPTGGTIPCVVGDIYLYRGGTLDTILNVCDVTNVWTPADL